MTPTLYNATGKEIFVLVDGVRVALPPVEPPQIWNRHDDAEQVTFTMPAGEFTLSVGSARPDATFQLPPEREGAFYLVEDATLMRLPHRSDLLTVGRYTLLRTPEEVDTDGSLAVALTVAHRTLSPASADLDDLTNLVRASESQPEDSRAAE